MNNAFAYVLTLCSAAALLLSPTPINAQALGTTRVPNTELVINEIPDDSTDSYVLERIFPNLTAANNNFITQITEVPDGSDRMVAVFKNGEIKIFPKKDDPELSEIDVFFDLTGTLCLEVESGLQSIAFDPDYATNGEFYLVFNDLNGTCDSEFAQWVLARYTDLDSTDNSAAGAVYEELLRIDTIPIHHAALAYFGPDNYLYVGKGSGFRKPQDPYFTYRDAQDLTVLSGSILRLDVRSTPDPGLPYAIPPDNPFAGHPSFREEIYAYGLRNPYKFQIDEQTGIFYIADVGQSWYEEVNILTHPGQNFSWPVWEGTECRDFDIIECEDLVNTPPVAGFDHQSGGDAIIGGGVNRSPELPELFGAYLFADFGGEVCSLIQNGSGEWIQENLISSAPFLITGSGYDSDGQVFFMTGYQPTNYVYTLRPNDSVSTDNFPRKLSDMPALLSAGSGQGHTIDGVYPYEPSAALWSDGAVKERYMAPAGLDQVGRTDVGGWDFTDGSVLVKNFSLPLDRRDPQGSLQRIETRIMVQVSDTWYGYSYEWNEEETDGFLLRDSKTRDFDVIDENGSAIKQTWYYPSRNDCSTCHTALENEVLGISTAELNWNYTYPGSGQTQNQLEALNEIDLFTSVLPPHRLWTAFPITATNPFRFSIASKHTSTPIAPCATNPAASPRPI